MSLAPTDGISIQSVVELIKFSVVVAETEGQSAL